jgi:seryl-tRNA synthetase
MIDIKALEREQPLASGRTYAEEYRLCLKNRKDDPAQVDTLLELNRTRKKYIGEMETKKAEQNRFGPIIAQKKRNKENADSEIADMQALAAQVKELEVKAQEAEQKVTDLSMRLPNMLHPSVPVGVSEHDNVVVHTVGEAKKFAFKAKEHWELGEALGMIDFERAGKVTGARFAFLKKGIARLERGLMNFMLDLHTTQHGYTEMLPPFIVNSASLTGTGNFPKFYQDVFHLADTDYHLIPTAEVPVTNYFRDEILEESDLPQCFVAYSPCFRSEAGSYGKDTRGLIRQHQFEKVELMKFTHPDQSYEEHEKLTSNAEQVLRLLELPFQRVALCSGDISFGAAKCYDLNVWLPGQNGYREISSCSNFEDFQARRAGIRFRPKGGKPAFVHTLNGSGLAIGRTVIAIMENYQCEDGSIDIPKVLQSHLGGLTRIEMPSKA